MTFIKKIIPEELASDIKMSWHKNAINYTGQKFGKLTVISFYGWRGKKKNRFWLCRCDCGGEKVASVDGLTSGKVASCGCLISEVRILDLSGKNFGRLTAIKFDYKVGSTRYWLCKCICGHEHSVSVSNLRTKQVQSCGDCHEYRNGKRVSKPQFKIRDMIDNGILNFQSGKYFIDIAFVQNGKKIGIEYDGFYYHKKNIFHDKKRIEYLLSNGWNIISVKSRSKLPTNEQLNNAILAVAQKDRQYVEIILSDWGDQ